MMKNIFLVSPVAEFHRWTPETDVTPKNLRVLENQLSWASSVLDLNGYEVKTSLQLASLPPMDGSSGYRTQALRLLFRSSVWNREMERKDRETVEWCDAVALMPECRQVLSSHVDRVKENAKRLSKPVLDIEDIVKIDSGDFRRSLSDIEKAVVGSRTRRTVLMKGGRQR